MKDIEELLRMTESPQDYSDEELQQMMSDPEMREYYELMVTAEAGFAQKRENQGNKSMILLKIAAVFVGVLLLSGIAYAAYRHIVGEDLKAPAQVTTIVQQEEIIQEEQPTPNGIRTFEDVELQQILSELSDYYHIDVEFRSEQTRHIRLYTKWDTTAPLDQMIERLNGFEKVSIHLTSNRIIAE